MRKRIYRKLSAIIISYSLILAALPLQCAAQNGARNSVAEKVKVNVGKPNVWSLAQAHYLLANMRQWNRGLAIPAPTAAELSPYSASGINTSILRSFFGAEAQYNGGIAANNRAVLQKYEAEYARWQMLQAKADAVQQQYLEAATAVKNLANKREQLAADDPQRAVLETQVTQKTSERDALNTELASLNTQLATPPTLGALASTMPYNNGMAGNANDTNLEAIFDKVADKNNPKLSASQALDSYIQLQYELIAKQLTLLRDETGPNERLIFLELPCDIYTVPKIHDDYLVQVEWQATRYFALKKQGGTSSEEEQYKQQPITLEEIEDWLQQRENQANSAPPALEEKLVRATTKDKQQIAITKGAGQGSATENKLPEITTSTTNMRVLDLIPRQSALNVNDIQEQTKGLALATQFWTLFGLGGKVSYQRQQKLYGQYLNQDVYASGYGKGQSFFGWTFGPLPGSKRLAPGVRTTYAILNVPAKALALELQPIARVFHRKDVPGHEESTLPPIRVLIPGERTQGFWIDAIHYAQARRGQYVTARLSGKYFSPLTGVLVNGQPLTHTVSIAHNESLPDAQGNPPPMAALGEYEYLNSNELIMRFKMPESYLGTPVITLVTPEKASPINHYDLDVNDNKEEKRKLSEITETEPMFLDDFEIKDIAVKDHVKDGAWKEIWLTGKGFQKNMRFFVYDIDDIYDDKRNRDRIIPEFRSTTTYKLLIKPKDLTKWKLTCQAGNEEKIFNYDESFPALESVENLNTGKAQGSVGTEDTVVLRGWNLHKVDKVWFGEQEAKPLQGERDQRVLLVKLKNSDNEGSVRVLLTTEKNGKTNIADFMTPGRAIYKFVSKPPPPVNTALNPSIESVENQTTRAPEGALEGGELVILSGVNLGLAEKIYFGSEVVKTVVRKSERGLVVIAPRAKHAGKVKIIIITSAIAGQPRDNLDDFNTSGKALYGYKANSN